MCYLSDMNGQCEKLLVFGEKGMFKVRVKLEVFSSHDVTYFGPRYLIF